MGYKLGVLLDPPDTINPLKDTSLAIMIAAQKRDWEVSFFSLQDLLIDNGDLFISSHRVELHENAANWHTVLETRKSSSKYLNLDNVGIIQKNFLSNFLILDKEFNLKEVYLRGKKINV